MSANAASIKAGSKTPRRERLGVRDRVVELVRVRAGDLVANPGNWRRHPERQRAALRGLLRDVGYADALLARRDGEVLVLDVSEAEADTLLATLDPLAALARPDPEALASLLERVQSSSQAVMDLLAGLARGAGLPARSLLTDPEEV